MRVLVLCTGNRCRSQMAEGWLKKLRPDWTVRSAGINPACEVHPLAKQVMKEVGISIDEAFPKSVVLTILMPSLDVIWRSFRNSEESETRSEKR